MELTLRPYQLQDADLLHRQLGLDSRMTRYTGWNPYATPESSAAFVQECAANHGKTSYSWIIEDDGQAVGVVGAYDVNQAHGTAELGYSVFCPYWGKGYATCAARLALEELRHSGLTEVSAWTATENKASAKVLEACGFKLMQVEPDGLCVNGTTYDKATYQLRL